MHRQWGEMKLTAYALGELEGAERGAVEARLIRHPDEQRFVEDVRAAARAVTEELAREPADGLESLHYAAIEMQLRSPSGASRLADRRAIIRGRIGFALSLAASIAILGGAVGLILLTFSGRPDVALRETNVSPSHKQVIVPLQQFPGSATPSGQGIAVATSVENPFVNVEEHPVSRFAMNVDTASYDNLQRAILDDRLPAAGTTRIEGLINAFTYDYPAPAGDAAFAGQIEVGPCPWQKDHLLARVAIKAQPGVGVVAEKVRTEIAFNRDAVRSYRVIGFDRPAAGDAVGGETIRGGHAVTALYELALLPAIQPASGDLLTVRIHYRRRGTAAPETIQFVNPPAPPGASVSTDFQFASAVAELGMLLEDSSQRGGANMNQVLELAQAGIGPDSAGERHQFIELAHRAKELLG